MTATVADVSDNRARAANCAHPARVQGFSLEVTDLGQAHGAAHQDALLKTLADAAVKRLTEQKATDVTRTEPTKAQKFGASTGKWLKIDYKDADGLARTSMIFVLWGEKYTVSAVAEFRHRDRDDVAPRVMNIVKSVRPLQ